MAVASSPAALSTVTMLPNASSTSVRSWVLPGRTLAWLLAPATGLLAPATGAGAPGSPGAGLPGTLAGQPGHTRLALAEAGDDAAMDAADSVRGC
jgi:hypothetical protein